MQTRRNGLKKQLKPIPYKRKLKDLFHDASPRILFCTAKLCQIAKQRMCHCEVVATTTNDTPAAATCIKQEAAAAVVDLQHVIAPENASSTSNSNTVCPNCMQLLLQNPYVQRLLHAIKKRQAMIDASLHNLPATCTEQNPPPKFIVVKQQMQNDKQVFHLYTKVKEYT